MSSIDASVPSTPIRAETLTHWIHILQTQGSLTPHEQAQFTRYKLELLQLDPSAQVTLLEDRHHQALKASAIADATIRARQYRTITAKNELLELGFDLSQCQVPGLLLPLWSTDGLNVTHVYRPDNPRCFDDKSKKKNKDGTYPQKVLKYEYPKGVPMRLDCPPACQPHLADPSVPLWITEGQKKADSLVTQGACAIALLGVFNWRGSNELGGTTVLADWEHVALKDRDVRIVFDSDINRNRHIQVALSRLADWLRSKGGLVRTAYLPETTGRTKTGVDDWLSGGHTLAELEGLLREPAHKASRHERITSAEYIEVLTHLGYEFRMLELDYTIEVNGEPLNDSLEAEIRTKLRDAGYNQVHVARDAYHAHAYQHRYNPIKNYLEAIAWDGQDHIQALAKYFVDQDGVFHVWLRKWLTGAIARVYRNGAQNRVLVLDGAQDLGKSHFVRWLASGLDGKYYIDAPIDPENKDDHIRLMNIWIWEIGELHATTGKADRNALKQFLSREQVRVRVPYGRNDITRPALTSFIATANNDGGFFDDPTGNRRFAACTLKSIDWSYATSINVDQVWAQAKHLFSSGENWRFTGVEKTQVNEINSRYEVANPIFEWLDELIVEESNSSITTIDIISHLRAKDARGSDRQLSREIASYMKVRGIEKVRLEGQPDANGKRVQSRGWAGVALKPGLVTGEGK